MGGISLADLYMIATCGHSTLQILLTTIACDKVKKIFSETTEEIQYWYPYFIT
jgi:hypothetical protein